MGELEARLVLTMPVEVYEQRRVEVQQVVELLKSAVPKYDTLLTGVVHTWTNLA